jgi:hypothetical protein
MLKSKKLPNSLRLNYRLIPSILGCNAIALTTSRTRTFGQPVPAVTSV